MTHTMTVGNWVVTFNRVNDFNGLRRMSREEAEEIASDAARWNHRLARVVNVYTLEEGGNGAR